MIKVYSMLGLREKIPGRANWKKNVVQPPREQRSTLVWPGWMWSGFAGQATGDHSLEHREQGGADGQQWVMWVGWFLFRNTTHPVCLQHCHREG